MMKHATWNLSRVKLPRRKAWAASVAGGGIAMLAATAAMAISVLLPPGGSVPVPATTDATEPDLAGVVQQDPLLPFKIVAPSGAVLCEGNLQDRVVKSTKFGLMDFYFAIRDLHGPGFISRMMTSGFATTQMKVAYRTDGLGVVPPKVAVRSAAPGATVVFEFEPPLPCGKALDSRFILIKSDSKIFKPGGKTEIVLISGEIATLATAMP